MAGRTPSIITVRTVSTIIVICMAQASWVCARGAFRVVATMPSASQKSRDDGAAKKQQKQQKLLDQCLFKPDPCLLKQPVNAEQPHKKVKAEPPHKTPDRATNRQA